jgi:Spy/CpxP family protein refolding chaperone
MKIWIFFICSLLLSATVGASSTSGNARFDALAEELKLSDEQKVKIQSIVKKTTLIVRQKRRTLHELRKAMQKQAFAAKVDKKALNEILVKNTQTFQEITLIRFNMLRQIHGLFTKEQQQLYQQRLNKKSNLPPKR